jgi:pheromone shutdown protein TraB
MLPEYQFSKTAKLLFSVIVNLVIFSTLLVEYLESGNSSSSILTSWYRIAAVFSLMGLYSVFANRNKLFTASTTLAFFIWLGIEIYVQFFHKNPIIY